MFVSRTPCDIDEEWGFLFLPVKVIFIIFSFINVQISETEKQKDKKEEKVEEKKREEIPEPRGIFDEDDSDDDMDDVSLILYIGKFPH